MKYDKKSDKIRDYMLNIQDSEARKLETKVTEAMLNKELKTSLHSSTFIHNHLNSLSDLALSRK